MDRASLGGLILHISLDIGSFLLLFYLFANSDSQGEVDSPTDLNLPNFFGEASLEMTEVYSGPFCS